MSPQLLVGPLRTTDPQHRTAPSVERWTLNRPQRRNALNPALVEALTGALSSAERRGVGVVVIDGNGPSFCAGADLHFLSSHNPARAETPRRFLESIWDLTLAIETSPVIVVAALHGHAVAGGLELALACDVVIAEATTLIGDGHVANNLMPGGGSSARLERALGRGHSSWLALSGELLPASNLAFSPWIHRLTARGELAHASHEVAVTLAKAAPQARTGFKRLLHSNYPAPTIVDRDAELDAFDEHWLKHDVRTSLQQFLDKRSGRAS